MKNFSLSAVIKVVVTVLVLLIGVSSFTMNQASDGKISFPYGYRKWTHIKTAIVGPHSPAFQRMGGFHHIYANEKAVEGYKTGNFPEGSIIVFDVIEAVTQTSSDITEGKRKLIDVMIKNTSLYSETGGWGYEEFTEGNKNEGVLTQPIKMQCFSCHTKQTDFIFSDFKDESQQ
jgi:hypothetical protein